MAYAELYGVDSSLEELATYLQWADYAWAHVVDPDRQPQVRANLTKFWEAAQGYPASADLLQLDGIAHRMLGFSYQVEAAWLQHEAFQPALSERVGNLMRLAASEFERAAMDFEQVEDMGTQAAQMEAQSASSVATGDEWAAGRADATYATALSDQLQAIEAGASKGLSFLGALGSSPWLYLGLAGAAIFFLVRR